MFSDGAYEIVAAHRQWQLDEFVALLSQPFAAGGECARLHQEVTRRSRQQLDDDCSLLVVTFP